MKASQAAASGAVIASVTAACSQNSVRRAAPFSAGPTSVTPR